MTGLSAIVESPIMKMVNPSTPARSEAGVFETAVRTDGKWLAPV